MGPMEAGVLAYMKENLDTWLLWYPYAFLTSWACLMHRSLLDTYRKCRYLRIKLQVMYIALSLVCGSLSSVCYCASFLNPRHKIWNHHWWRMSNVAVLCWRTKKKRNSEAVLFIWELLHPAVDKKCGTPVRELSFETMKMIKFLQVCTVEKRWWLFPVRCV